MNRRHRTRSRQKQINILHTTTKKRQSQRQVTHLVVWGTLVLGMVAVVGIGLHLGVNLLLNQVLYTNPRYSLNEIDIEPRGRFTEYAIRQAANLEKGQNLWTLNLPQITKDLETLPYVSNATVERHFPDKLVITIKERVPVVKIVGLNTDLGAREPFYLDRDRYVLKPRDNETAPVLPEIIGLTNAELEPGLQLDQPILIRALEILDAIDHSKLHTTIDIRTINLSDPLSITMTTTQDMQIRFQLDSIDEQLRRLNQVFNYADNLQRTVHTVDLTASRNVPITFNE
jgi:cell division septal protein FtsQ